MKRIGPIVVSILALFPLYVSASENFHIEFCGAFINQTANYHLKGNTLLNPDSKLASFPKWENKLYKDSSINLTYKEWLKLAIKSRPTWIINDEEGNRFKIYVDNAYLNIRLKDTVFFTIGKENIQEGVGLSYNPTDFLTEGKTIDYSKREEERKNDREGDYLIRFESIGDKLSYSILVVPKIDNLQQEYPSQLLRLYSLVGDADVALSYFHEKQSKLGLNLSGVIGNNIELHMEMGITKGSEREFLKKKREIGPPNSGIYEYEAYNPQDKEKTFITSIIGGHYTFHKTNFILEYFFNEDGYSQSEWDEFMKMVKEANDKFKNPPYGFPSDIFKENLRIANSLMTFRQLRKNYLFLRLSNPEMFDYYDSQLSLLLNIDDGSYVIMPSVDYKKFKNLVIRFGINWFCGGTQSEFRLVPQDMELQMKVNYFF